MNDYKMRRVEYAEWGWGRPVPYFCATTLHHSTELIRLVSGNADIFINGEKHTMKKGDLYIVRPLTLHTTRKTGEGTPIVDFVKFDLRRLAEDCPQEARIGDYLQFLNYKNAPCVLAGDNTRYDADRIIAPLFKENSGREETQKAVFGMLKLLHEQRGNVTSNNITEERQHFAVQTAVEYISTHYSEQVQVDDVAKLMGYDEFYAMKLFKKFCGWTVIDYLNGVRVNVARNMLKQTDDSSREIAVKAGYKSASYFNRQFKKMIGVTPTEYRQQFDNNN